MKFIRTIILMFFYLLSCKELDDTPKSIQLNNLLLPDSSYIWLDNFDDKKSHWEWTYNSGTGYKKILSNFDGKVNVVEGGITGFTNSTSYSDCSLITFINDTVHVAYEAYMKFSSNDGIGTKGFGFWDGIGNNFAWFFYASDESTNHLKGFNCIVRIEGNQLLKEKLNINLTDWHSYRVDLVNNKTIFYIDGTIIAEFNSRPINQKKCSIWVDNYKIHSDYNLSSLSLERDEVMYIDWVKRIK